MIPQVFTTSMRKTFNLEGESEQVTVLFYLFFLKNTWQFMWSIFVREAFIQTPRFSRCV